ncbi:MAG: hypothetical protein IK080_09625 [Clostridia bacterium]|nr:hypothetical protein [Clostridia bacterium]
MKKHPITDRIRRAAALLLCASLLLLCCACGRKAEESGVRTIRSVASRNTITGETTQAALHYTSASKALGEKLAASGLIELYADKTTNSFSVLETTQKAVWSALPTATDARTPNCPDAAVATLRVSGGTDLYILNTQDHAVAFGRAGYTLQENGAVFTYEIFPDEKTAAKEQLSSADIGFRLQVTVTLQDGSMLVHCTHENLSGNPNARIESITLLNYFGAYNDRSESDYLLVPDGSGAIIKTAHFDESFEALTFDVYGSDPAMNGETAAAALIPAFGMKHGNSAVLSLITQGDSAAAIHAVKAQATGDYNRVFSDFTVTPTAYDGSTLSVSNSEMASEIALCYRFLSGKNATYAGLASACREQLIRNGVLSTKTVAVGDYLPFCLTLTGAVRKHFGPLEYTTALTTFEQANDMLVRMKNKGINNINLRYTGAFTGGTEQTDIANARLLTRLGGSSGLEALNDYIANQKMSLYLDVDLLSSAKGFSGSGAADLYRNPAAYTPDNTLADYLGEPQTQRRLRAFDQFSKLIVSVLSDTRYLEFTGFCLNDVGTLLYSDFSANGLLRDAAADRIRSAIPPLSTGRSTMAVGGNFYMLKNIDTIVDLPMKATAAQSGAYVSVPFVPLVLHGIVDYAGEAINTSTNLEETLLKYIEYGACPHFQWNYEPLVNNTQDDPYYYDNTINSAADFYARSNKALNDLRDARMTDHYAVADGVYCTEYDTGAMIYVNYTDSDYETLGVVVEARNFLRVH